MISLFIPFGLCLTLHYGIGKAYFSFSSRRTLRESMHLFYFTSLCILNFYIWTSMKVRTLTNHCQTSVPYFTLF